jgi:soluble lytic murein transglycosylase
MPKAYREEPIWSYWYARALETQGYSAQAKTFYASLADKRNYYGLLASSHLKKTYPIKNSVLPITKSDSIFVSNQPNLIRARELYAINRYADGNKEWWRGIDSLSEKQRYIAGKLAVDAGWPSLALATTSKLTHQDDLSLKFPTTYQQPVATQAKINNLQPALLFAVIRQESLFQPSAISVAGARGLMQLMPSTAKFMANKLNVSVPYLDKLHDPNVNIHLGSAYLNSLLQSYKDYPVLAIASYNAGPTRVKSWLPTKSAKPMDIWVETIPYQETREYVKYVVTYTMIYEYLLGEQPNLVPYLQDIPPKPVKE